MTNPKADIGAIAFAGLFIRSRGCIVLSFCSWKGKVDYFSSIKQYHHNSEDTVGRKSVMKPSCKRETNL